MTAARTTPKMIMYWFSDVTTPRSRAGAISARYSGTSTDAIPTPSPTTNRDATSTATLTATPAPRAPTVNTTPAASSTRCRPRRSATGPLSNAPSIAPNTVALTTAPSSRDVSGRSRGMNKIAAPMMPLS